MTWNNKDRDRDNEVVKGILTATDDVPRTTVAVVVIIFI
jgi:hypothetical protein